MRENTRTDTDEHGQTQKESLIPKHGGYKNTKTWQLADLVYDVTVLFCDTYVNRRSRTHDQMVQAARSGVQNLQEGSVDSATSKKSELKLTGVAKGSLAELQRDFIKFLEHRGLPVWPPEHPALMRFKKLKCSNLIEFRRWVADEVKRWEEETRKETKTRTDTDEHGQTQEDIKKRDVYVRGSPCKSVSEKRMTKEQFTATCAANGALSLLNLCIYLVDRQMKAQADAFEKEGGFTERLYRMRTQKRKMV